MSDPLVEDRKKKKKHKKHKDRDRERLSIVSASDVEQSSMCFIDNDDHESSTGGQKRLKIKFKFGTTTTTIDSDIPSPDSDSDSTPIQVPTIQVPIQEQQRVPSIQISLNSQTDTLEVTETPKKERKDKKAKHKKHKKHSHHHHKHRSKSENAEEPEVVPEVVGESNSKKLVMKIVRDGESHESVIDNSEDNKDGQNDDQEDGQNDSQNNQNNDEIEEVVEEGGVSIEVKSTEFSLKVSPLSIAIDSPAHITDISAHESSSTITTITNKVQPLKLSKSSSSEYSLKPSPSQNIPTSPKVPPITISPLKSSISGPERVNSPIKLKIEASKVTITSTLTVEEEVQEPVKALPKPEVKPVILATKSTPSPVKSLPEVSHKPEAPPKPLFTFLSSSAESTTITTTTTTKPLPLPSTTTTKDLPVKTPKTPGKSIRSQPADDKPEVPLKVEIPEMKLDGSFKLPVAGISPKPVPKVTSGTTKFTALLRYLLKQLQKKDADGFFAHPVSDSIAPSYSQIIAHPMDLSTIGKKITSGSYVTLGDFREDVKLIAENAMKYNQPDTIYYKAANKLWQFTKQKLFKKDALTDYAKHYRISPKELSLNLSHKVPTTFQDQKTMFDSTGLLMGANCQPFSAFVPDAVTHGQTGDSWSKPNFQTHPNKMPSKKSSTEIFADGLTKDEYFTSIKAAAKSVADRASRKRNYFTFITQEDNGSKDYIVANIRDDHRKDTYQQEIHLDEIHKDVPEVEVDGTSGPEEFLEVFQPTHRIATLPDPSITVPVDPEREAIREKIIPGYGNQPFGLNYAVSVAKFSHGNEYASNLVNSLLNVLTQKQHAANKDSFDKLLPRAKKSYPN